MIHYDKCWLSWLQRKIFLYAAVGAPDARLLKGSSISKDFKRRSSSRQSYQPGDFGYVSLVTVGDSAFPQFP